MSRLDPQSQKTRLWRGQDVSAPPQAAPLHSTSTSACGRRAAFKGSYMRAALTLPIINNERAPRLANEINHVEACRAETLNQTLETYINHPVVSGLFRFWEFDFSLIRFFLASSLLCVFTSSGCFLVAFSLVCLCLGVCVCVRTGAF